MKKFDFCVGNPPYQEDINNTSDKPVYNMFMDCTETVADKIELITPARFLFNAGKTPKAWNEKKLNDPHFKVLKYEPESSNIFPETEIKGGVAITYYDKNGNFEPIRTFIENEQLYNIFHKIIDNNSFSPISETVFSPESYKFTKALYREHPEILTMKYKNNRGETVPIISKGHQYDLTSNIFDKLDNVIFYQDKPENGDYILVHGRKSGKRCTRWIKRIYVAEHPNLNKFKMLFPKSSGSGTFGELISPPIVSKPNEAHTQTFISIGKLDTESEAEAEEKYIKTKFARSMLGILKVTQDNKKNVWKYVPTQDFTNDSDINWSKPIHEIDLQLYKKYNLSDEEIEFIETHVKEMN